MESYVVVSGAAVLTRWRRQDDSLTIGGAVTISSAKTHTLLRIIDANRKIVVRLAVEPRSDKGEWFNKLKMYWCPVTIRYFILLLLDMIDLIMQY